MPATYPLPNVSRLAFTTRRQAILSTYTYQELVRRKAHPIEQVVLAHAKLETLTRANTKTSKIAPVYDVADHVISTDKYSLE